MESWIPSLPPFVSNIFLNSLHACFSASKQAKKEAQGYIYSPESTYYLRVSKEKKLDELQKLMDFLSPISFRVFVDAFEKKPPLLQRQLYNMFSDKYYSVTGSTKAFGNKTPNQWQRNLVVVWDACTPRADYYLHNSCVIIMVEEDEVKDLQKKRINEISVENYLYFNCGKCIAIILLEFK